MARRTSFLEAITSKKALHSYTTERMGKNFADAYVRALNSDEEKVEEKAVVLFNMPKVSEQLKVMAAEGGTTVQALLTDAINDLFKKHGRPPIA
jgi:hypothetical protein